MMHICDTRGRRVINTLVRERCGSISTDVFVKLNLQIDFWYISCEIGLRQVTQNPIDDVSIGSGNGLVLLGTKPLLAPMLTQF